MLGRILSEPENPFRDNHAPPARPGIAEQEFGEWGNAVDAGQGTGSLGAGPAPPRSVRLRIDSLVSPVAYWSR